MKMQWGLLGPDQIDSKRRVRTLRLGAVTRAFNSLAVPHVGTVRFGKQLLLATCGVKLADDIRTSHSKIQVTNAVEALASWIYFKDSGWDEPNLRARGRRKLARYDVSLSFRDAVKPSAYVSQPWRMSAGEAIWSLGLIDSSSNRFNSFNCSQSGLEFIDRSFDKSVLRVLERWIKGDDFPKRGQIREQLKISTPLKGEGAKWIKNTMIQKSDRLQAVFNWLNRTTWDDLDEFQNSLLSKEKPVELAEDHWHDIFLGALFFKVRDTAEHTLIGVEHVLKESAELNIKQDIPQVIRENIKNAAEAASDFKIRTADWRKVENPVPPYDSAIKFCDELIGKSDDVVLENLVSRDGKLLKLYQTNSTKLVIPGPIFGLGVSVSRNQDFTNEKLDDLDSEDQTASNDDIVLQPTLASSIFNMRQLTSDLKRK